MLERIAAKWIAYALVALAFVGMAVSLKTYRTRALAAETQAESLGRSLVAHINNADRGSAIAAAAAKRERALSARARSLAEEVRRARVAIPDACRPALAPIERALDGLRELRSERDRPAPARPVVQPRPRTTFFG